MQWAGYMIDEFPNWKELEATLNKYPEIDDVFVRMYKKGYEDSQYEESVRTNGLFIKSSKDSE